MGAVRRRADEGFSLTELLVVILVLGILATIVIMGFAKFSDDTATATCKSNGKAVDTAEAAYYAKFQSYASVDDLVASNYLAASPSNGHFTITADSSTGAVSGTHVGGGACYPS